MPQCLGSNDADLALKNPDIAKKILKVNIKNDNEIEMISYGDVRNAYKKEGQSQQRKDGCSGTKTFHF